MKEFQIKATIQFMSHIEVVHYCTVFDSSKITVEDAVARLDQEERRFSGYHIVSYKVIEM